MTAISLRHCTKIDNMTFGKDKDIKDRYRVETWAKPLVSFHEPHRKKINYYNNLKITNTFKGIIMS